MRVSVYFVAGERVEKKQADAPRNLLSPDAKIFNMANEGIAVVQTNNRRVAAAKKAAAGTARNLQAAIKAGDVARQALEAAQKAIEVSRKEHDEATKEAKNAEQSQKAAQMKWEVVDLIDEDDNEEKLKSDNGSKKRLGESSSDSQVRASKKVRSRIHPSLYVFQQPPPEAQRTSSSDAAVKSSGGTELTEAEKEEWEKFLMFTRVLMK